MIGLEYIRKLHSDTSESLAEKLNISKSIISQWENGKKTIPQKRLEEISAIYNVPVDWISKDLSRIEKLELFKTKLTTNSNNGIGKYTVIDSEDSKVIDKVTIDGDSTAKMMIEKIDSTICIEKIVQDIYELVGIDYIDYDSPFDIISSSIMADETMIYLLDMFVSLMYQEPVILLASLLKAVEQSNNSETDTESCDPLVDDLAAVIRKWKIREEEKKQAEEKKLNNLLGIDCE